MRHPQHPVNARIRLGLVALALVLSLGAVDVARAAPANDNFAQAVQIEALPFSTMQDTTGATTQRDEPWCFADATVWFRFTPSSDVTLNANTVGSSFSTILNVYTGNNFANHTVVHCEGSEVHNATEVVFAAAAGVTYHFQVGGYDRTVGTLQFNLGPQAPPFNDNFADAPQFLDRFHERRDTTFATMEPLEPQGCGPISHSVWYGFTPSNTRRTTVYTGLSSYAPVVAAYLDIGVGTGFERLVLQACGPSPSHNAPGNLIEFVAVASTTYYFQVGAPVDTGGGSLVLRVGSEGLP